MHLKLLQRVPGPLRVQLKWSDARAMVERRSAPTGTGLATPTLSAGAWLCRVDRASESSTARSDPAPTSRKRVRVSSLQCIVVLGNEPT